MITMNIRMKERQHNGEIVVYQPDEITRLEVMVENETVTSKLSVNTSTMP